MRWFSPAGSVTVFTRPCSSIAYVVGLPRASVSIRRRSASW
jgi:hypothetical protein